jgi:heavy metal sensor kinase
MRSVRTRLTLWYGAALLLIVAAFALTAFLFVRARLLAYAEHELDEAFERVEATVRRDPQEAYELEKHGAVALYEVREGDRIIHRTAQWAPLGLSSGNGQWTSPQGRAFRLRSDVIDDAGRRFRLAVAWDETSSRDAIRTLGLILLLGIPCAGALALVGGYGLAGRLLAPVGAMADKAREISAERLSERLPVENPGDEFGRLSVVFNETLSRLQDSFEQLRRFTADASHELRTPLTALRSVGEVALQKRQDAASYRDVIGSMLEEVDRLSRLVECLLMLTRADSGALKPVLERVDLVALARGSIELLRVLAEEKEQVLSIDGDAGVTVMADPGILRQAILNLVDNAIKYTPHGGRISMGIGLKAGMGFVEVKDSGPGIPAEHRDRIFERFYRVDKGRSREAGGVGLGLAIAKWATEINGGRIEVESEEERGSRFRIVLNAARPDGR